MTSALSEAGMAQSIIDFVEYNPILNELRAGTSKQERAIAKRFEQAIKIVRSARGVLEKADRAPDYENSIREKWGDNAIEEFLASQNSGQPHY